MMSDERTAWRSMLPRAPRPALPVPMVITTDTEDTEGDQGYCTTPTGVCAGM